MSYASDALVDALERKLSKLEVEDANLRKLVKYMYASLHGLCESDVVKCKGYPLMGEGLPCALGEIQRGMQKMGFKV